MEKFVSVIKCQKEAEVLLWWFLVISATESLVVKNELLIGFLLLSEEVAENFDEFFVVALLQNIFESRVLVESKLQFTYEHALKGFDHVLVAF